MTGAGFVLVSMTKEREVSSRRPYASSRHDHLAAGVDFSSLVWLGVVRRDQAAWFLYLVATHDGSGAEGGGGGGGST